MKYRIQHATRYGYTETVPVCHNQVHLAPRDSLHQSCDGFRLMVSPAPSGLGVRTDYFGNRVDRWKRARRELLDSPNARRVFASPILAETGLDDEATRHSASGTFG